MYRKMGIMEKLDAKFYSGLDIAKKATFNDKFKVDKSLGTGKSAHVYLISEIDHPENKFSVKMYREENQKKKWSSSLHIFDEFLILKNLKHKNILKLESYGSDGLIRD
jgi:hypothetical protein